MKLIGRSEIGFVIDMSLLELSQLCGYRNYTSFHVENPKIGVGNEIKMSEMYNQLTFYAKHQKELGELALSLENYAKQIILLDPIVPAVEAKEE